MSKNRGKLNYFIASYNYCGMWRIHVTTPIFIKEGS